MPVHTVLSISGVRFLFVGILSVMIITIGNLAAFSESPGLTKTPEYSKPLSDAKVDELMERISAGHGAEIPEDEANHLVAHLRRKYPFESIRDRLPKRHPKANRADNVELTAESENDLNDYEALNFRAARTFGDDVRSKSLELLHSEQVREFVARDGNGRMRTPPPSAIYLELGFRKGIPFDYCPTPIKQSRGNLVPLPEDTPRINKILTSVGEDEYAYHHSVKAYKKWATENNPLLMPDRSHLYYIHQQSHDSFLHGYQMGFARSVDQVAGFEPHQVSRRPTIDISDNRWIANVGADKLNPEDLAALDTTAPGTEAPRDAIWLLTQLRLVSLLMHGEPLVYESDELPKMGDLDSTRTVKLDKFESRSLRKLYAGHHLEIEPRENEIRMLGAIRCSKTCLTCHDAQRGELLGAFTYTLSRKDPLPQ